MAKTDATGDENAERDQTTLTLRRDTRNLIRSLKHERGQTYDVFLRDMIWKAQKYERENSNQ